MIQIIEHTLPNGLKILVNPCPETGLIAANLIYKVGARDENPDKTGFAHLFEHLMFGGSVNIPDYDLPLQFAGGENNAFTNNDYTNYYITLPHQNLETAFWLESDRMLQLDFSEKNLDIQRKVVIEEYHQRYLNQPYGDIWLLLRPLAFTKHPYQWPAIGKTIAHVEEATLQDVQDFFYRFYAPDNCILSLSGHLDPDQVFKQAEKWFGDIPARMVAGRNYPDEPVQLKERRLEVSRSVPQDVLYMTFHMGGRTSREFYEGDLLSDILSNGPSSRLFRRFVKEEQLFTEVNAFITGDLGPGLFVLMAKTRPGISLETAEQKLWEEIERLKSELIGERELTKVKNKIEANHIYGWTQVLNKAMSIGFFEMIGKANDINHEMDHYRSIGAQHLQDFSSRIFRPEGASVLYYKADQDDSNQS